MENEQCWILHGAVEGHLWWGYRRKPSEGEPAEVVFDYNYVLSRDKEKQDVVGWMHTHPGMLATPSERDIATMNAWVDCLGRPLVCCIEGIDGLKSYWFVPSSWNPDDEPYHFQADVLRFGGLLVGTKTFIASVPGWYHPSSEAEPKGA